MPHDPASPEPDGLRPSTLAVHAGEERVKPGFAMTDPVFCTATYTFANTQAVVDYVREKQPREEYARYGNPSEKVVERKLAALEGGEAAITFSSGMAAVAAYLLAKLKAGDEVVLFDECYHRTRQLCREMMGKFGVVTHTIPACDYERMEAAINGKTKLLVSESPTNPHLSVVDLERFAALGKKHGVETLIDATLATPYNVRPLAYGVDCVLHSCTKYLGGHNDLLAGAIIGSQEVLEPIRKLRGVIGTGNSPHAIYLLQRGLKTLELRMQRHNENGLALARFLESHPRVERVYYPGLASHRDHEVARRTMRGFGGLSGQGCRHPADGPGGRCGPAAAYRPQPGRGGIAHRAALPHELPRFHAGATARRRHPRQHDPRRLRNRESRGPDRRLQAGPRGVTAVGGPFQAVGRGRRDSRERPSYSPTSQDRGGCSPWSSRLPA
jgi:cystathionine gamma-synthase